MATTIELEAEPLTAEAFTPCRQLIAARDNTADYARPLLDLWHLDYRADTPIHAAMRTDAMLEAGDLGGYAVWKRVLRAGRVSGEMSPKSAASLP